MTKAILPIILLSKARLRNPNAEQTQSRSLAFWICVAREASVHNWPKPEVVLKGPDNVFFHMRKLPTDIFQMRLFIQGNCYPLMWQNKLMDSKATNFKS